MDCSRELRTDVSRTPFWLSGVLRESYAAPDAQVAPFCWIWPDREKTHFYVHGLPFFIPIGTSGSKPNRLRPLCISKYLVLFPPVSPAGIATASRPPARPARLEAA